MTDLFDTTGFVPRAYCGTGWTSEKIWWDNFANLLVFWAYVAIPVVLFVMYAQIRKSLPDPEKVGRDTAAWNKLVETHPLHGFPGWVIIAFGMFILSCGIGRYWEVLVFKKAMYNLYIAWNILTGVVSWIALVGVWQAVRWLSRKFLVLWRTLEKTVADLEASLESERKARQAKDDLANELHAKNRQMHTVIESLQAQVDEAAEDKNKKGRTDVWANAKHATLDKLLANVLEITKDAGSRHDTEP